VGEEEDEVTIELPVLEIHSEMPGVKFVFKMDWKAPAADGLGIVSLDAAQRIVTAHLNVGIPVIRAAVLGRDTNTLTSIAACLTGTHLYQLIETNGKPWDAEWDGILAALQEIARKHWPGSFQVQ
jgi:hypothetical protein